MGCSGTFADGFAAKGIEPSDYFILPRHAWVGSWRYSAALWSGDIVSTFDELAIQIKVLQGVMMSGVSLWTTDIGGYHGGDPTNPTFQELIVRWFQFGVSAAHSCSLANQLYFVVPCVFHMCCSCFPDLRARSTSVGPVRCFWLWAGLLPALSAPRPPRRPT